MVSHSSPLSLVEYMSAAGMLPFSGGKVIRTRTNQGLEAMLWSHRPKLWVFGHYHKNFAIDSYFLLENRKISKQSFFAHTIIDYVKSKYDLVISFSTLSDHSIYVLNPSLQIQKTTFVCLDELSSLHFDNEMNVI